MGIFVGKSVGPRVVASVVGLGVGSIVGKGVNITIGAGVGAPVGPGVTTAGVGAVVGAGEVGEFVVGADVIITGNGVGAGVALCILPSQALQVSGH